MHLPAPEPKEGIGAVVRAVAEPVAEGPVGDPAEDDVDNVLHHDIHLVLQGDAARLEHAETLETREVLWIIMDRTNLALVRPNVIL